MQILFEEKTAVASDMSMFYRRPEASVAQDSAAAAAAAELNLELQQKQDHK
jgi:hypothetical protein